MSEQTNLEIVVRDFEGTDVEFRQSEDGQLWLTAREIGELLGYTNPAGAIRNIVKQHEDEFTNDITQIHDTCIRGNRPPVRNRLFNLDGMILLCMFSERPVAKKVRAWLRQVGREVLTTGRYEEPRLIAQTQQSDMQTMVTDIVSSVLKETLPVIMQQIAAVQTPAHPHGHFDWPMSVEYEKSHYITAPEWARLHHRVPERFNMGGGFNRYCFNRYVMTFGETPRQRQPGMVSRAKYGDVTYPIGPETDKFLNRCYQDYVRTHHPKQGCLFRLKTERLQKRRYGRR